MQNKVKNTNLKNKTNSAYLISWVYAISSIIALVLASLLINRGMVRVFVQSICILMFLLYIFSISGKWKFDLQINNKKIFELISFCTIIIFQIIDADYSLYYTIKTIILLFVFKYFFTNYNTLNLSFLFVRLIYFFYSLFTILILYNMIFNSYFIQSDMVFSSCDDKNYTAVLMFLYFAFCLHFRFFIGILLSTVFFVFFNSSRSSILLIATFFFCMAFKEQIFYSLKNFKLDKFLKIFSLMTLCIIGFSYYWVSNVSVNNLQAYRQGLNDGSNKMRFTANIYAIDMVKKDNDLFYRGYGFDIRKVMGVDEEDYSKHTRINGVRLVQPHNSIINVLIRLGIVPGILYFIILASTIDLLYKKWTIEFIFPYLLNSMFMHSLLDGFMLGIWIIIICLVYIEGNNKQNESRK